MTFILSIINCIKNIAVSLWDKKIVRLVVGGVFAFYLIYNFSSAAYTRLEAQGGATMPTVSEATTIIKNMFTPDSSITTFNSGYKKSNKSNFSVSNSITMLIEVFVPGILIAAIIMLAYQFFVSSRATALPILYTKDDDLVEEDYRIPMIYTKGESEDEEDDEDEQDEE
ncbi:MAG: hypothetical protein ATN35_02370 [Epulopiscium sp. Nele67-Bin004]|nr:MAG: hypothetical protein ATN35_02370 [Epulopiscium sp. Nele67-Bin004]